MIVISDTTPLNYLALIGQQDLLARLFERVVIPRAVWIELQAEGTPEPVRSWIVSAPEWLEVRQANLPADAALSMLDSGEQEAILLAQELHADLLLIDDKDGRLEATRRNIAVVGTLGILDKAAEIRLAGLTGFPDSFTANQLSRQRGFDRCAARTRCSKKTTAAAE